MWKAMDFLVVCGRWSKSELVALAIQSQQDASFDATRVLPKAINEAGPVSMVEINMLKAPRVDPALIRPITTREDGPQLTLDDCLHNVVATLYGDLQTRLG
jgi:hypothetical protein